MYAPACSRLCLEGVWAFWPGAGGKTKNWQPYCFVVYGSTIPGQDTERLRIGLQFALNPDSSSSPFTDAGCNRASRPPRLTFPAHTAPLDVRFNGSGTAFVALHGSWNRQPPVGY